MSEGSSSSDMRGWEEYKVLRTDWTPAVSLAVCSGSPPSLCSCRRALARAVSLVWNALPSNVCVANSCWSLLRGPLPWESLPDFPPVCPPQLCSLSCFIFFVTLTAV